MKKRGQGRKDPSRPKSDTSRQVLQPSAHATIGLTTAAFALSRGWSIKRVNQVCGLSDIDLANPYTRTPDDVAQRLWRALAHEWPNEAVTLQVAQAAPFSCFAGLAEGMQFATNLRQALQLLIKNQILLADRVEMELIESAGRVVLTGHHPAEEIDQGRTSEMVLILLVRMIREYLGVENAVERMAFRWGPSGPPEAYERQLGVPVEFDKPRTEIVFRQDRMATANSQSNADVFAYVSQDFARAATRIQRRVFPAQLAQLREAIVDNAGLGEFSGRAAATRAQMSLRSAQRLAAAYGSTLCRLIDQVRAEYTAELLSDPGMTTHKVAELVGYSDDRALRRAFKRWTGQTPSQYRRRRSPFRDRRLIR